MTDTLMEKAYLEGNHEDTEDTINPRKLTLIFIVAFILVSGLTTLIGFQLYEILMPKPWYVRLFPFLG